MVADFTIAIVTMTAQRSHKPASSIAPGAKRETGGYRGYAQSRCVIMSAGADQKPWEICESRDRAVRLKLCRRRRETVISMKDAIVISAQVIEPATVACHDLFRKAAVRESE